MVEGAKEKQGPEGGEVSTCRIPSLEAINHQKAATVGNLWEIPVLITVLLGLPEQQPFSLKFEEQ